MKQLSSKHPSHGKEHHNFISLISFILLFLGLLSLLYLLAFCHLPDSRNAPFFCHASAREKEQGQKNEISDAIFLSRNGIHSISLQPYSHKYYYIVFQENCTLKIPSDSSSIRVTCYLQNGNAISIPKKNHQYHFEKVSGKILSPGDRLFLKFANTSTKACTIKVQYSKSSAKNAAPNKTATPKPKKAASSRKTPETQKKAKTEKKNTQKKSKHTKTMPNPLPKATPIGKEIPHKKAPAPALTVKPHFLRLALGTKKELSLSLGKTSLSLSDCTYFLTDSSLLSIHGNTILGKKEGITILYLRSKKSATCSSCLIRVTKK